MYRPAFFSNELESQLNELGYAVMPLLKESDIASIQCFYAENQPDPGDMGFHSTHFYRDREYKRMVHLFLKEIFKAAIPGILKDYEIRFCNFMVKEPGQDSRMPLHTDWTYVDETQHRSLAIWCPLVDTNELNGALGIIPGSHLLPIDQRGPRIATPFHDFNEALITASGQLLHVPAGHAVIYDHRLMHFSPPNLSQARRIAINIILTPAEAEMYHYCIIEDPSLIHVYKVPSEEFFIEYDAFQAPDLGLKIETISNPYIKFSREDLSDFLPMMGSEFIQCNPLSRWIKQLFMRSGIT
jgi:hypothetical protein